VRQHVKHAPQSRETITHGQVRRVNAARGPAANALYRAFKTNMSAQQPGKKKVKNQKKAPKKVKSGNVTQALKTANIVAAASQAMMPGAGPNPGVKTRGPTSYSSATLAHTMALLNPWDSKYNGAKVPSDCPIDSAVFRTHELIVAGCPPLFPNDAPQYSPPNMGFNGFGGFVMRPNALGRQYQYTAGTDFLGFNNGDGPGLVAVSESGSGQSLVLNMFSNNTTNTTAVPVAPTDRSGAAWISPMAMSDIQLLGSKYRVTSAGLKATYIGPEITESGQLAMGVVPYDKLFTQDIQYDTGADTFPYTTINWQQFVNFKDVVVVPAASGGHMRYMPLDTRAYEWKETILSFQLPLLDGAVPSAMQTCTTGTLRSMVRRKGFRKEAQALARKRGLELDIRKDGTVSVGTAATITKEIDKNGRVINRRVTIGTDGGGPKPPPPGPSPPVELGAPLEEYLIIPWFHGAIDELQADGQPQPEDTPAGDAQVFVQAVFAALASSGLATGGLEPTFDNVNGILNLYQDTNWSEAEDLMVMMWNNVAPADAILNGAAANNWAGNIFQIDKYVNYEVILDLNSLDIGAMPPSAGTIGSSSLSTTLAKAIAPVAGSSPTPPASQSWLDKAGAWLSNAKDKIEPWISAGSKAWTVASTIADVLGML